MELTSLKQSSPYFRLLPRSRQPDKGGHFSSPTLPAIKGEDGYPFVIPNRDLWSSVRNLVFYLRFFLPAVVRMTSFLRSTTLCHSERMRRISCYYHFGLGFFTSLCFVRDDSNVISNVCERSHVKYSPAWLGRLLSESRKGNR